ncbi:MAG: TldD/PmbA family protein [Acidimicrobiaceae bacterium]|nr:TldD/PmbA family protein [Acidimicrobiaceae bacterium]
MTDSESRFEERLLAALPADADYASARHVVERSSRLEVRNGVVEPSSTAHDEGVMFSVWTDAGAGYAATSDLSDEGLARAVEQARGWAATTAGRTVIDSPALPHTVGEYASPVTDSFDSLSLADQVALLVDADAALGGDARIVDRSASLVRHDIGSLLLTNGGGRVAQEICQVFPDLRATANEGSNTQNRTYGAGTLAGQGGAEVLARHGFRAAAERIADEAVALLDAPNCPTGTMDLILAPDQMALQIHESIGHPLELDRILGDERNYAGTSFVTREMFGTYQYGSELLNVTFDPTVPGQMASYGFDDDGTPAERTYLIKDGVLQQPMGGAISQARSGMAGVANSRASSWNRAPIDRMANLNVEPGGSTLNELIAGVEHGVLMETNVSWSIDDSRNKFQFGAELGRVIENGEVKHIVRNPNYRGISATFWRNLSGVADDFTVMAVGNCGKGEPNQVIRVGHASPHCRFSNVEVFGGEQ